MLKWKTEALLQQSYSDCSKEGCFCINLTGSLNLWQLSLRKKWSDSRGSSQWQEGHIKSGPIRQVTQDNSVFWLHCGCNDSWLQQWYQKMLPIPGQGGTGGWDAERTTKSRLAGCQPPPIVVVLYPPHPSSQHVQSELFIRRNVIPARHWNRILFVAFDSIRINNSEDPSPT